MVGVEKNDPLMLARQLPIKSVALILAGGRGTRLKDLTNKRAKPAVHFGGKFRIIDFALSNCINSGIRRIGVITQYQSHTLVQHIQRGWSFFNEEMNEFVDLLPAQQRMQGENWYRGTADAVTQNLDIIRRYKAEYVVILAGDHIYKMDYADMLAEHIKQEAAATIAVRPVPWEEASRFGIMNTDDEGRITEFEEKPKNPKSNKASMGVYVFTWPKLREYLRSDELDPESSKDFGKNIIPKMLSRGEKMGAYSFSGYWKDVGTIESLWDANMDLLQRPVPINLHDRSWRIYARNVGMPPHYVFPTGSVENSLITEGCEIAGEVRGSVLSAGVVVEEGAQVVDSVIMPFARIKKNAVVHRSIVAENAVIGENARVGEGTGGIAVVGTNVQLPEGAVLPAGEQAGN